MKKETWVDASLWVHSQGLHKVPPAVWGLSDGSVSQSKALEGNNHKDLIFYPFLIAFFFFSRNFLKLQVQWNFKLILSAQMQMGRNPFILLDIHLTDQKQNGNHQGNKQISLTPNRLADFGNVFISHWHSTRMNFTVLWQKVGAGTRLYLYSFRMESWHLYTISPPLKPKASCANLWSLPLLTIPYNFGLSLQVNLVT